MLTCTGQNTVLKKAGRWMTAMLLSALCYILWMLELVKLLENAHVNSSTA